MVDPKETVNADEQNAATNASETETATEETTIPGSEDSGAGDDDAE